MTAHEPRRGDLILEAIETYTRDHGYGPSVRDLMRLAGLRSPAAVQHHLDRLERDGLIARDPVTARSIRALVPGACPTCGRAA